MAGIPLYRGQGNESFRTANPRSAAKRGQIVPYDLNGRPSGSKLADGDYGDIVVSGSGSAMAFDPTVVSTFSRTLLDDANATAWGVTLGLAALAYKATINNSDWSGADLDITNGGTGASSAAAARNNLGAAPVASPDFTGTISLGGAQLLTIRRTGWGAPTGTATRSTFDTATITLPQLAERMKALIDDLTTHGVIGA